MSPPPLDLAKKIREIAGHSVELSIDSAGPLRHYEQSSLELWNTLNYVQRKLGDTSTYAAVLERHMTRLHGMILVNLVESFERFLKEIAAVCVNHCVRYVLDDRFNVFAIHGSTLAVHHDAGSLGHALCESAVWLDCEDINKRFRKVLAEPFSDGNFYLFPRPETKQSPAAEQWRTATLGVIWQLRHSIVHNVGVVTVSDAVKLRMLVQGPVDAPRLLTPTRDDLRWLRRFLDETAELSNRRIGEQLAKLLTKIYQCNPSIFVPAEVAKQLAIDFGLALQVAGVKGLPPP